MMNELCYEIEQFLPLNLESSEWNDPVLHFYGKNWGFSTMSPWRIVQNNRLLFGWSDETVENVINKIKNYTIVSIQIQSNDFPVDPVFIFSNGYRLEVFSTFYLDPWVFQLPSGAFYNGNPSDPKWVKHPVF